MPTIVVPRQPHSIVYFRIANAEERKTRNNPLWETQALRLYGKQKKE
jgi:hypothetical protein